MWPGRSLGDDATFIFVLYGRLANLIPVHTRYVSFTTLQRALACNCRTQLRGYYLY